jgi:Spy/CpxP family protein refolding chaperone
MKSRRVFAMAAGFLVCLALASPALAQKSKGTQSGKAGAKNTAAFKAIDDRLEALDLTSAQRERVDAVFAQHRPEAQKIATDMRGAKQANDEKALAAGREQAKALRGQVLAEIRPILTPEQQKKLKHAKKH